MQEILEQGHVGHAVDELAAASREIADEVAAIAVIPSPTFHESARAAYVRELFSKIGFVDARLDEAGNVRAQLAAAPDAPERGAVLVCAHLDCAYPEGTPVEFRREGPMLCGRGVGDNSSGIAVCAAAMRRLSNAPLERRRRMIFAATVGEEGQGGLKGIRHLLDADTGSISEVVSVDGRLGSMVTKAIAVRRHRITVEGSGGHSWADYGRPSANVGLVRIADALSRIRPPAQPRTTLNIGVIRGGSSINAIAERASLDLDLRSESDEALASLEAQVMSRLDKAGRSLSVEAELIDERPSGECPGACALVRDAERALRRVGLYGSEVAGSTEANIPLSRGLSAMAFGAARVHDAHAASERVEIESLGQGAAALFSLLALRLSDPT